MDSCGYYPRRSVIALLGAALMLAAAACSDDGPSTASTSLPAADGAIAGQVDVDGRSLYLECRGTGSPTVVLQSGYGNAGDIWSVTETAAPAVFPAVAETNRVCIYDRPGSGISTTDANGTVTHADTPRPGRSGPVLTGPRDPAEVVTELHDLLAAADVPAPYVLVGHSWGACSTSSTPGPTPTRSPRW